MTDKAPERIWAFWTPDDFDDEATITAYETTQHGGQEYVCADICDRAADTIEALEAERDEAKMQSLADLGQAQEAYEAQLKAEAQLERFRGYMVDIAIDYINNCPEGYIKFANKKMEEMKDEI